MSPRPPCVYQPQCPGCPRFGSSELPAAELSSLRALSLKFNGPLVQEFPYEGLGHRYRSRLSVRGRVGHLQVGIFEAGSHRLVSIPECPVHHPAINTLHRQIVELGNAASVQPYDETRHTGQLRAVQFAVQPASGQVQLSLLVCQSELSWATLDRSVLAVAEQLGKATHSVHIGSLPHKTNSLFAESWLHVSGPEMMEDSVGGARVFYPPDAFGQANPILHAQVVRVIHGWVTHDAPVVEYYAGVGSIGLGLLRAGHQVVFNEISGGSLSGLRHALSEDLLDGVRVEEGAAGDFAQLYTSRSTVIVDPPRKGLDPGLLQRLLGEPPRRLIYLSCGLPALLREVEQLMNTGLYQIRHLSAWAYFPFTGHLETLLVLDRASAQTD